VYRADEIGNYPSFLVSLLRTVALDAAHNQANLSDSCKVLVAFLPPHDKAGDKVVGFRPTGTLW